MLGLYILASFIGTWLAALTIVAAYTFSLYRKKKTPKKNDDEVIDEES